MKNLNLLKNYLLERMDFVSPESSLIDSTSDNGNIVPDKTIENIGLVSYGEHLDNSGNIFLIIFIYEKNISKKIIDIYKKDKNIDIKTEDGVTSITKKFYDQNEIGEWKRNFSTLINNIYLSFSS